MNSGLYSIEVLVGGRPVREFSKYIDGEYRTFIEGRAGSEYQIRIKNNSYKKLLAIAAVDSINVITGDTSDAYNDSGYIIQPYDSLTIKGYRESDNTVGAFKFTNKHSSYAEEIGMGKNSGIIAVNLIEEKVYPVVATTYTWPNTLYGSGCGLGFSNSNHFNDGNVTFTCSNSATQSTSLNAANFMQANQPKKANFDLGSTWGQRVEDKITHVNFERGNVVCKFQIYYASRHALESMGIDFYPKKEVNEWPQGFVGYCKPPKGWC